MLKKIKKITAAFLAFCLLVCLIKPIQYFPTALPDRPRKQTGLKYGFAKYRFAFSAVQKMPSIFKVTPAYSNRIISFFSNPQKNIKLATYASRCIENEILMYLRRNSKTKMEVSIDEP